MKYKIIKETIETERFRDSDIYFIFWVITSVILICAIFFILIIGFEFTLFYLLIAFINFSLVISILKLFEIKKEEKIYLEMKK